MNINDAIWVGCAIGLVITSIGGMAIRWYFWREYLTKPASPSDPRAEWLKRKRAEVFCPKNPMWPGEKRPPPPPPPPPIPEGAIRHTVTLPSRCKHCGRDL